MIETEWNDVVMGELPTGTVTLLLADVEGSTRLWQTQPEEMTAAVARLDQSHLTRVYTKLGLTSRVQLAQEAARRADATQAK